MAKWFLFLFLTGAALTPATMTSSANAPEGAGKDPLEEIFYRKALLLGSEALVPRPTREVVEGLRTIVRTPSTRPEYLRILAAEEIALEEVESAENHFLAYVKALGESEEALTGLAAFYESRGKVAQQVQALRQAMMKSSGKEIAGTPLARRASYSLAQKILKVIEFSPVDGVSRLDILNDLVRLYPSDADVQKEIHQEWIRQKATRELRSALVLFRQKFPEEKEYAVGLEAEALELEGTPDQARSLLESSFQPLWPDFLLRKYSRAIRRDRNYWKERISSLSRRLESGTGDTDAAVRLFYAFQQEGNLLRACQVLNHISRTKEKASSARAAKGGWLPEELYVWGILYKHLGHYDEAAGHFYSLYNRNAPPAVNASPSLWPNLTTQPDREEALYQLFDTLIEANSHFTRIGSGNLAYFSQLASMDRHPGLLNGILSILLNRTDPGQQYRMQEEKATAYFNARRAESLYRIFLVEFPKSGRIPIMQWQVLRQYAKYGAHEAILRLGEQFLQRFPDKINEAGGAGILLSDAYLALNRKEEAWKTYERLLDLLARRGAQKLFRDKEDAKPGPREEPPSAESSEGNEEMAGDGSRPMPDEKEDSTAENREATPVVDYEFVLQRYISALAGAKLIPQALTLFRREIERHPQEAGLYERLSSFLEQNRLDQEVEAVYLRAIQQFKEATWYNRLARWYLRRKMTDKFLSLSQQLVESLPGDPLATYLREILEKDPAGNRIYLQVNLLALQRFPHNLTFVRNLLRYYSNRRALVPEWEKLTRRYFFFDSEIQKLYLGALSSQNRLGAMTDSLAESEKQEATSGTDKGFSPAERAFLGSARTWRSRFEEAEADLRRLASDFPAYPEYTRQLVDLQRSLGARNARHYQEAAGREEKWARLFPTQNERWIKAGEIWADAGSLDKAVELWNQIAVRQPRNPERIVDAATVFWDYYLFDPAEKWIRQYRTAARLPDALFYEMGAILESRGEREKAVGEYLNTFSSGHPRHYQAERRLEQLLERPEFRKLVLAAGSQRCRESEGYTFLVPFLQFLARQAEDATLENLVDASRKTLIRDARAFQEVRTLLRRRKREACEERLLKEWVQDKRETSEILAATSELAGFYESYQRKEDASRIWEQLAERYPKNLGVIESGVAYYVRTGRVEKALELLAGALPSANPSYRKQFLSRAGELQLDRGNLPEAEKCWLSLLAAEPENTRAFSQLAEVYRRQNDLPKLAGLYQRTLEQLTAPPKGEDPERRQKTEEIRLRLIDVYQAMKEPVPAIDLYKELLNRNPENPEWITSASRFADTFGQKDRLVDFFTRQAARSSKDYRWPLLLARIQKALGNREESIPLYSKSLEIQPTHLEALRELTTLLEASGRWEECLPLLRKIHVQTYRRPEPLREAAEILGLQKRIPEALAMLEEAQQAASLPKQRRWRQAALSLLRWNQVAEAAKVAEQGWNSLLATRDENPMEADDLIAFSLPALRRQQLPALWDRLIRLGLSLPSDHPGRETVTSFLEYTFPGMLKTYGSSRQLDQLDDQIRADWNSGRLEAWPELKQSLLTVSQNADLAYLEEWIWQKRYQESRPPDSRLPVNPQIRRSLTDFYRKRFAHGPLAQWLVSAVAKETPVPDPGLYLEAARYFRLAGKSQEEKESLVLFASLDPNNEDKSSEAMERLAVLLRGPGNRSDSSAIEPGAASGSIPLVNAFLFLDQPEVALRLIRGLEKGLGKKWSAAQQALIGWKNGAYPEDVNDYHFSILGLKSIGERLSQPSDPKADWIGRDWFYLASSYAQSKAAQDPRRKADAHLHMADLEGSPQDTGGWLRTGEGLMGKGSQEQALSFFRQAVELQPGSFLYQIRYREALLAAGQDPRSLAAPLREIVDRQCSTGKFSSQRLEIRKRHVDHVLRLSLRYGFFNELSESFQRFLEESITLQGHWSNTFLLEEILPRISKSPAKEAFLKRIVLASPHPQEMVDYFFDSDRLEETEKLPVALAVVDHLKTQSELGEEGSRQYIRDSRNDLLLRSIDFMLETGNAARAQEQIRLFLEDPAAERWIPQARFLQMKALRIQGKAPEALRILEEWVEKDADSYLDFKDKAEGLFLKEEEKSTLARCQEQYYRRKLLSSSLLPEDFLGLIRSLYRQKKNPEAQAAYRQMSCLFASPLLPENEIETDRNDFSLGSDWQDAVAEIAEESGDFLLATQVRQQMQSRLPVGTLASARNLCALARVDWKSGRTADALLKAQELLPQGGLPASAQRDTAWMLWKVSSENRGRIAGALKEASRDDPEIQVFLHWMGNSGAPAPATLPRYASLMDRAACEEGIPGIQAEDLVSSIRRLVFLDPEDRSRRLLLFRQLLRLQQERFALEVLDPSGEFAYGYIPQGKRASLAFLRPQSDEGIASPMSQLGLSGESALRTAREAFLAALEEQIWETADYYGRLMIYFSDRPAELKESLALLRRLKTERQRQEAKKDQLWRVSRHMTLPPAFASGEGSSLPRPRF